jgi:hypothetical protein
MKKIVLLGLFAIAVFTLPLQAQEDKLRVAVFDPSAIGVDEGTKIVVREMISSVFVNTGKFSIVERSLLDQIMREQEFSNTDAVDESQATQLGKLAGAHKVVLSVVTQAGSRNMLSVKVIDVQTATVEKQQAKVIDQNALLDEIEPLTQELLGERVVRRNTAPGTVAQRQTQQTQQVQQAPQKSGGILKSVTGLFGGKKDTQEVPVSQAASQPVSQPASRPATVARTPNTTGGSAAAGTGNAVVRSVLNFINEDLEEKVNRYRTDEERLQHVKSDGKLKDFIKFGTKFVGAPPQVDGNQVLFFYQGGNKGNDALFLFVDGKMTGVGTIEKGLSATVPNDGRTHIITVWKYSSRIFYTTADFAQHNRYVFNWNGKTLNL